MSDKEEKKQDPFLELNKKAISTAAKTLSSHYTISCTKESRIDSDRPDNIVSCYPKVENVEKALRLLIEAMLPGKFSPCKEIAENLEGYLSSLLEDSWVLLQPEIEKALPFGWVGADAKSEKDSSVKVISPEETHKEALEIIEKLLSALPEIRKFLLSDIIAAYNGDPAVLSYAEVKLASPGLTSIASHRIAHTLYSLNVPLIPRIMAEWTHSKTGIDIHPGATIGEGFFIDHGTGVVIGETSEIGKNVKLYQSVTIGAKSFPLDDNGNPIKHIKRHPTLEDDVVVYSNATILGGDTVIGKGSVVAGNVFLTKSVPAGSLVTASKIDVKVRPAK